ncbi:acyltransferase family protein, partial [Floccifex sp.]|uniref:acyltransferase family protein n=1 Tax=Floccifex sp. TaxID=2815810 RepID=UPI003F0549AE
MERDSFFDNYKAFLIICVVLAHFLNHFKPDFEIANIIRIFIYFFHVPAFVFISGYFAHKKDIKSLIRQLAFPYILFQLVYYGMYQLIDHNVHFSFYNPYFTLWYIIGLFFWRLILNYTENNKYLFPVSFVCALLIGFLPDELDYFSIYRMVSFFPFFVLGHQFKKDKFMALKSKKIMKCISILSLVFLFVFVCKYYESIDLEVLNYQDSYENLGIDSLGVLIHLILSVISSFLIVFIGILVPLKSNIFTIIGRNTMSVYLLHGLIYKYVSLGMNILDVVDGKLDLLLYIILLVGMVFALSLIPLNKGLNSLYDFLMKPFHKMI